MTYLVPVIFFTGLFVGNIITSGSQRATIFIGILDEDIGYDQEYYEYLPDVYNLSSNPKSLGSLLVDLLEHNTQILVDDFNSDETEVRIQTYAGLEELKDDVETQSINLGVVIPENFTTIVLARYNTQHFLENGVFIQDLPNTGGNTSALVIVDQSFVSYLVSTFFSTVYSSFTEDIYGSGVFNNENTGKYEYEFIDVTGDDEIDVNGDDEINSFFRQFPSFILVIILLNLVSVVSILSEENEQKTTTRMMMSQMPNSYLFIAIVVNQILVGTIQMLLSSLIIEMIIDLPLLMWLKIFVVIQFANINIAGLGLLIASAGGDKKYSLYFATMMIPTLLMISGIIFPLENFFRIYIVEAWDFHLLEIFPTFVTTKAINMTIFDGATFGDLLHRNLPLLVIFSVMWLLLGLIIYSVRVMRSKMFDRLTMKIQNSYYGTKHRIIKRYNFTIKR